jgi:hypothetical protein
MRPSPAYQHYAQSHANDCCYPQRWHIWQSQPCNLFRKSILSGYHTNPQHPEGHAGETQYEAAPLLDNNNHPGLSAFLCASPLLPHTVSDTQSALAAEVSNIFMKTAGAAIVALNRGYDFGRQYSACACVSHYGSPSRTSPIHTIRFQIQYAYQMTGNAQFHRKSIEWRRSENIRCDRGWLGSRY